MSKIYFTKVNNIFAFQKLITCRSHISADYIQYVYILPVKHKEYSEKLCKWAKETHTHTHISHREMDDIWKGYFVWK